MATDTPRARWKRWLGYSAFFVVAFLLCLLITFPYDALRARLVSEAATQGYALRVGSLRPGLHGLTATDIRLSKPPIPLMGPGMVRMLSEGDTDALKMMGPAQLGEALQLQSVAVSPSIFPLGVSFYADALDGSVAGSIGVVGDLSVHVLLDGLQTSAGNLKGFSGMDMEGSLDGELSLHVPRAEGNARGPVYDFSLADGDLTLEGAGLLVKGGTITVPVYGTPTPVDLPRIGFGDLKAELKIEKGMGTLEQLSGKSEDLEIRGSGTLKLAKHLEFSEPAMDFKIKADPAFTKRLGLLGSGLSMLPADRQDPSFRVGRLTGFIGRPKLNPGR